MLQSIAASLEGWAVQVKREKAVYHTLNKFSVDVTRKARPASSAPAACALHRVSACGPHLRQHIGRLASERCLYAFSTADTHQ